PAAAPEAVSRKVPWHLFGLDHGLGSKRLPFRGKRLHCCRYAAILDIDNACPSGSPGGAR
ncbi:MAG: hypothetical protein ACRC3F_06645, partial [Billgrantia desiderata]